MKTLRLFLSIGLALAGPLPYAVGQVVVPPQNRRVVVPQRIKERVQLLSGNAMLVAARTLGMTDIMGKSLRFGGGIPRWSGWNFTDDFSTGKDRVAHDVAIGKDPVAHENEPTIVANPKNKLKLVAGSHFLDYDNGFFRCAAYHSRDAGKTWRGPIFMPQLTPESLPSDPVLAFAPDGSRVYYVYIDVKMPYDWSNYPLVTVIDDWDIVVSYSDDGGVTWTGPIVALDGDPASGVVDAETGEIAEILDPGFVYDKCWIGTHTDEMGSRWVYVTATRFDEFTPNDQIHIAFTRSRNKAVSWSSPTLLETVTPGPFPYDGGVIQGSRPIGGKGSDVLVAWYNSGTDGWLQGGFEIRTRFSNNNGARWKQKVTAVADEFEAPYYLGPFEMYHRWWGTMFPDVEIDRSGAAHVVYGHDPEGQLIGSETPEDGDIRYIRSSAPPYASWSAPITINDDKMARAQGYAALKPGFLDGHTMLHVIWEDHRLSPEVPPEFPNSSNLYYDIFYSANVPDLRNRWSRNVRVTDAPSISDFSFIGDYNDIADLTGVAFGIWTDRRHQTSTGATIVDGELQIDFAALEDNVFGSGIGGGAGAPEALASAEQAEPPESYALYKNYPNPFNPETEIRFQLSEANHIVLRIFNVLGQEIRTLTDAEYAAGYHSLRWDGRDNSGNSVPSGVYLCRFEAGTFSQVKKMNLIR